MAPALQTYKNLIDTAKKYDAARDLSFIGQTESLPKEKELMAREVLDLLASEIERIAVEARMKMGPPPARP